MEFIDLKTQYKALQESINSRIQAVLDHGQYIMGPEIAELEQKLVEFTGAKHCITVSSGTEALLISLMALGVNHGDEIITTPFSFIATAEVIVLLGAKPVFVDIEPDTCNIDASRIEEKITARTKAIMPVSLYGQPGDMEEINSIASKYGIPVIEDAAQSFGATYKGKFSCNLSTIGCTSFFPSKPLGCYGDGGAIFTNDSDLAKAMAEIRVHGQSKRYVHTRIGVGGRMDTIQAAVLLAKLDRFRLEIEQRLRIGRRYNQLLEGKIDTIIQRSDRTSVFAQYTVLVEGRAQVQEALKIAGIPTSVHYPVPMHRQPAYKHYFVNNQYWVSENLAEKVLSLPMHPELTESQQDMVVHELLCATSN